MGKLKKYIKVFLLRFLHIKINLYSCYMLSKCLGV